jgi:hypothetical protein
VNWTLEPKTNGAESGDPGGNVMLACTAFDSVGLVGYPQPAIKHINQHATKIDLKIHMLTG